MRLSLGALVAQSYPSPEWAVFYEVSNTTGFGANRRADAIALGIWPSRGQTIVGFEFKSDRGDWLREMKNPAKAEAIASQCDCWYVVAAHDGVVKPEELPGPWGLLVANEAGTRLKTVKPAQQFEGRDKTIMRRSFAAAMLRKVSETTVPKAEIERLVEERVAARTDRTRDGMRIKDLEEDVQRLNGYLDAFKQETGVDLRHGWRGPRNIGKAVNAMLDIGGSRRTLENTRRALETAAKDVDAALASMPEALQVEG